jgi:hypothetical protein
MGLLLSTSVFAPKSGAEETAEGLVSTVKLADLLRVVPTFTIVDPKVRIAFNVLIDIAFVCKYGIPHFCFWNLGREYLTW